MKPTWVYSLGRCSTDRSLHVVRTRHPDSPLPQPQTPHGAVGIGQHPFSARKREPQAKSDEDVAAVIREAFPRSERSRLRALAAA